MTAQEPRTAAGRYIIDNGPRTGHYVVTRDDILAIEAEAARADGLTVERLARALHATALRNHNHAEGPQRAICQDPASHGPRATAILAALDAGERA